MFWRIEPPVQHDDLSVAACVVQAGFLPVEQEWSYWNRPKYEMKLNIAPGEAAVFAGLGTKIRTKVRHASKRGVLIEEGCTEQDMEIFYRLLKNTGEKKRIPVRGLDYLHCLYRTFIKSGMARLVLARKDGMPVAGGMTVRYGTMATLLYLSNDYSMQRAGDGPRMRDLRFWRHRTGYPPQETDKGYGVYQFKHSFGADIIRWYGCADYEFLQCHIELSGSSNGIFLMANGSLSSGRRRSFIDGGPMLHRLVRPRRLRRNTRLRRNEKVLVIIGTFLSRRRTEPRMSSR
jgi:hypothetical protein